MARRVCIYLVTQRPLIKPSSQAHKEACITSSDWEGILCWLPISLATERTGKDSNRVSKSKPR